MSKRAELMLELDVDNNIDRRHSVAKGCFRPYGCLCVAHGGPASAYAFAGGGMSKRAELMLELVVDIKNNRRRSAAEGSAARPPASLPSATLKWLRQQGVEQVAMPRSLTWVKLLQTSKKGALLLRTSCVSSMRLVCCRRRLPRRHSNGCGSRARRGWPSHSV